MCTRLAMSGFAEMMAQQAITIGWLILMAIGTGGLLALVLRSWSWKFVYWALATVVLLASVLFFQPWQLFVPHAASIDPDQTYWESQERAVLIGWLVLAIGHLSITLHLRKRLAIDKSIPTVARETGR